MKKKIGVTVKRFICLVMICALTIGTCPLPIAAAEGDETTTVTENVQDSTNATDADDNTDTTKVSESQSADVQESGAATEEVATQAVQSAEVTTEQASETTTEESTTEEVTTEEITTEETTTEEVTTEETTTEEMTTEEVMTEEVTTEEQVTTWGLRATSTDSVELVVSDPSVSGGSIQYHYESSNGERRFFTIEVNGSANITMNREETNEETIKAGKDLANETTIKLVMESPDGTCQTVLGSVTADDNLTVTATVSNRFEMKTAGDYRFYTVVNDPYGNEYACDAISKSITIPSSIGVVVENPQLSVSDATQYPETGICTAFQIPSDVSFQISLTGLDAGVSASEREEEIRKVLSKCKFAINSIGATNVEKTLDEEELVKQLIANGGNSVSYTIGGKIQVTSAGEHEIFAEVDGVNAPSVTTTIEKLAQSLTYTAESNDQKPYAFQKDILCKLSEDSIHAGTVKIVVTDEEKNVISDSEVEVTSAEGKCLIKAMNPACNESKTYTVTFEHSGNDIYESASTSIDLSFERTKADITYESNPAYGTGTFSFSKKSIEFKLMNGFGNVTYYESNADGEKLGKDDEKHLTITKKNQNANVFEVKVANKEHLDDATYYMTFEFAGDQVYTSAKKTISLHYVRETPTVSYQLDSKKNTYRYDDKITYTLTSNHVEAEDIEYYESNENGVQITNGIINITRDENRFIVTADNSDSENYETKATHYITFKFTGDESYVSDVQTFALTFAREDNKISYIPSCGNSDFNHEYGEVITYYYKEGNAAGGISCYQSDVNGNKLDSKDDLIIEKGDNGSFKVTGKNLSSEGKPFYVTIAHAENGVYLAGHQTFEFNVDQIDLQSGIEVHELEDGIFFKTRKMYVDVFISGRHNNLKEEDVSAISFDLTAILTSDSNTAVAMKHNDPVVSYDNSRNAYRFRYEIEKDFAHSLQTEGKYQIKATAKYSVDFFKDFSVSFNSLQVMKSKTSLKVNGETARSMEYSKDTKTISYQISGENFTEYPVACTAAIEGEKIIEIVSVDNNSVKYKLLKAGTTNLVITLDDSSASKYDAHKLSTETVSITVTSPSNTDYTINGKTPEEFINSAVTIPGATENWYEEDITFSFGEDNLYTQIRYNTDGQNNWVTKNIEEFVISESMPTDYTYYFCNEELGISSENVKPAMSLDKIGVDKTNPSWNTTLVIDQTPSVHSDDKISYFSTGIVVTGYAGTKIGSTTKVDAGSGIEKVLVQYGNSGKWEEVVCDNRYSNSYSLSLEENKKYGTIKIKTVDYLGHESEVAEYAKVVCVDDVIPVVVAVTVDEEGQVVDYDGTWTNQQIRYAVDLLEKPQVSGIYKYEYAFVLRGTGTQPGQIKEWTEIDKKELEVIFGTNQGDAENYAKKNGTLYFRAQSNAGLTTTKEDMIKNQKEIRIWQEDLEPAKVTASIKPDASTGWYNAQTGEVSISFAYPEYDEKNCAPAVGIVYTLTTKTSQDGEEHSTTSRFYKGISAVKTDEGVVETVCEDDLTKGTILINKDSINTLMVHVEDAAGNKSQVSEYEYKADFIVPDIVSATAGGADIAIYKNDASGALYTKFSQSALAVDAQAEYGISEKQNFYMAMTQDQGGKATLSGGNVRDSLNIEPCTRGYVYLCAVDGAGNKSEAWTDGIVVDNQAPTGVGQQDISIVTKGKNSADFFNKDIEISLNVVDAPANDHYSGLKSVTYTLGRDNQNTEGNITVFESQTASLSWDEIEKNHAFETNEIVIDAAKNESNHAYIEVTATDYAGNTSTVTQELQIDVTNPEITISFDQNEASNETYYNTNRVARIDIKELNFDPNQVNVVIYKDGEEESTRVPAEGSWSTSEGNVHTTYITFAEDGDYSFEVQCTDLAGNEAQKAVADTFTIDKTKPVVEVTYDNNNACKDHYYSQSRTATITVTEHNFDVKDFEAIVTPQAVLGNWAHNGDVHRVTIYFDQEEHYSYTVNYTDLAGNTMDAFTQEEFVIDKNTPVIQISGLENNSANAGDVIPVVSVNDSNYDIDGVQMTLQNSKGQQIAVMHNVAALDGGYTYTLTNVNEQPDEIYTLTILATDMAGNESELAYHFSLNRNGSVYDLSQMSALVEKAYMRYVDAEDLQIYEMNVNTVEEFHIIVTRNGEAIASKETSQRPQNTEQDAIYYATRVEGNDEIGYEYEYTIYRESFEKEGIYNIMFYSRDKAGNEVNNTLTEKKAEITFVVDNSAPTVVVEGVEPGELYTEETKDINVYVSDNFKLQEAYFKLVDEDGDILKVYDYMELASEEGEVVTITLPSSDKKMSIQYYALDVAGNDITTMQEEEVATSFMITTNAWIRYIHNRKAVAGTVCAAVVVVAATGTGVFFRRRRKV